MAIKYFITDVDGVIFDTMPALISALVCVMRPFGILESQVLSYYRNTLGAPLESQIKGLMNSAGKSIGDDDIKSLILDFWKALAGKPIKLFQGVKETLDLIKSKNIFIMASSGSRTAEMDRLFTEFHLPCDFFLGSDKILKGDEHIRIFAEHFLLPKKEFCRQAAFIGDGTVDMQIASRNEIFAIGITNTIPAEPLLEAGAQAIITSYPEVIKLLQ